MILVHVLKALDSMNNSEFMDNMNQLGSHEPMDLDAMDCLGLWMI